MLEETADELVGRKGDVPNLLRAMVTVAETDLAVVEGFQAAVSDGDAEDVAAQIVEDFFTAPCRFAVNNPLLLPEGWGQAAE